MTEDGYFLIKAKCLNCGLHFLLCTWEAERHSRTSLWCPECGQHEGRFIIWGEPVKGFIFGLVPGRAPLLDVWTGDQR
jgi:hypothetical protein